MPRIAPTGRASSCGPRRPSGRRKVPIRHAGSYQPTFRLKLWECRPAKACCHHTQRSYGVAVVLSLRLNTFDRKQPELRAALADCCCGPVFRRIVPALYCRHTGKLKQCHAAGGGSVALKKHVGAAASQITGPVPRKNITRKPRILLLNRFITCCRYALYDDERRAFLLLRRTNRGGKLQPCPRRQAGPPATV